MKLNLEEQEETIEPVEKTDLIYGIDDRPPFKEALFGLPTLYQSLRRMGKCECVWIIGT